MREEKGREIRKEREKKSYFSNFIENIIVFIFFHKNLIKNGSPLQGFSPLTFFFKKTNNKKNAMGLTKKMQWNRQKEDSTHF